MKAVSLLSLLSLAAAGAASAQALPENAGAPLKLITVVGVGQAIKDPDYAMLAFTARGEAPKADDALKALAEHRARLDAGLASLAGAKVIERRSDNISVNEIRSQACMRTPNAMISTSGDCTVTSVVTNTMIRVRISPASKAGDAASYLTQLGAVSVSIQGGGVLDREALDREAMRKAVADAKSQASLIAEAAGARLGPVLRFTEGAVQTPVIVSGAPIPAPPPPRPPVLPLPPVAARLDLSPGPVEANARVTVSYALES